MWIRGRPFISSLLLGASNKCNFKGSGLRNLTIVLVAVPEGSPRLLVFVLLVLGVSLIEGAKPFLKMGAMGTFLELCVGWGLESLAVSTSISSTMSGLVEVSICVTSSGGCCPVTGGM